MFLCLIPKRILKIFHNFFFIILQTASPAESSSSLTGLTDETMDLISRIADLQQEKWKLEEKVFHVNSDFVLIYNSSIYFENSNITFEKERSSFSEIRQLQIPIIEFSHKFINMSFILNNFRIIRLIVNIIKLLYLLFR